MRKGEGKMNRKQWNALGYMFLVFCFLTKIAQVVACINDLPFCIMYGYWLGIWVVAAITCFICGRLEKEGVR